MYIMSMVNPCWDWGLNPRPSDPQPDAMTLNLIKTFFILQKLYRPNDSLHITADLGELLFCRKAQIFFSGVSQFQPKKIENEDR